MAKCKYCGQVFNSEEELQNHLKSSHKSMLALDEQGPQPKQGPSEANIPF